MSENEKIKITVCMGSSCFARGNADNLEFIEQYIQDHHLDAEIDLCGSRCENVCATGPHVKINGKLYINVTPQLLETALSTLSGE